MTRSPLRLWGYKPLFCNNLRRIFHSGHSLARSLPMSSRNADRASEQSPATLIGPGGPIILIFNTLRDSHGRKNHEKCEQDQQRGIHPD